MSYKSIYTLSKLFKFIAKELRLCSFCNKKIRDEYNILFTCSNDRIVQLR